MSESSMDLAGLLDRASKATGPDRHIDGDVAFLLEQVPAKYPLRAPRQPELWSDGRPGLHASTWTAPYYSASIDAALALVEKVLPGWQWAFGSVNENDLPWACLTEPDGDVVDFEGEAATPPLAILSALLSALTSLKAST